MHKCVQNNDIYREHSDKKIHVREKKDISIYIHCIYKNRIFIKKHIAGIRSFIE